MEQTQSLRLRQDIINGFSYSFTSSLLEKIKQLLAENRIFVDGNEKCKVDNNDFHKLTPIAEITLNYLKEQLPCDHPELSNVPRIEKCIALGEEFLQIFAGTTQETNVPQTQAEEGAGKVHIVSEVTKKALLKTVHEMVAECQESKRARILTCLKQGKINIVLEIVIQKEGELIKLRNFGEGSLFEVKAFLKKYEITDDIAVALQKQWEKIGHSSFGEILSIVDEYSFKRLVAMTAPFKQKCGDITKQKINSRRDFFSNVREEIKDSSDLNSFNGLEEILSILIKEFYEKEMSRFIQQM
jgi:hypothetical protein